MTWVVWRQHRGQLFTGTAILAVFAVLILITGLQMASQYHSMMASCTASHDCDDFNFTLGNPVMTELVTLTTGVPAIMGLFWGAPLVARELETGTSQFMWMQSVTRRRWLTVKLAWILAATAAWGGAIGGLVTWWAGPINALNNGRFIRGQFDVQGIVPIGYALFAVALGIAAGILLRRTLPALAATLAVFAAVRLGIANFVRAHYLPAVTTIYSYTGRGFTPAGSAWIFANGTVGPNGVMYTPNSPGQLGQLEINGMGLNGLPASCNSLASGAHPNFGRVLACAASHGYRGFFTYQPASRFWAFQGIETGIFVLLGAAVLRIAAFALLRRDA